MKKTRLLSLLLAVCLLLTALPLRQAGAADNNMVIYATNGGYLTLNRFTGTLEKALNISGDLTIPSKIENVAVTGIGDMLFYNFDKITSVTIPEGVKRIGDRSFSGCKALRTVTMGPGVESLGSEAFRYCASLTSVTTPSTLKTIGNYAFADCSMLKSVAFSEGLSEIGNYSFSNCVELSSVSMPNSLNQLGDYAFNNCISLKSIVVPSGITTLNTAVFNKCTSLTSVTLPRTLSVVGISAFAYCSSLIEVALPEGVTKISDWAFTECASLTKLTMPKSISSIAGDSFYGCRNFVFYVVAGSYAQVYASANSIPFVLVDSTDPGPDTSPSPGPSPGPDDPDDPFDPDNVETPFTDIEGHWAETAIKWNYSKGYILGMTETTFAPKSMVNRAMIVTILYRMAGSPITGIPMFDDVPADTWYTKPVAWGSATGVISGIGGGKYAPKQNVTREQFASMLYRYADNVGNVDVTKRADLATFVDMERIHDYAMEPISWAVAHNIMSGKGEGRLDPRGYATRAELASMLMRFSLAYPELFR